MPSTKFEVDRNCGCGNTLGFDFSGLGLAAKITCAPNLPPALSSPTDQLPILTHDTQLCSSSPLIPALLWFVIMPASSDPLYAKFLLPCTSYITPHPPSNSDLVST